MKRILFVVSRPIEINTSASIRNKAMLEGLILNGYEVDMVTTMPDTKHAAYDASLAVEGVSVTRISMNSAQKIVSLGRNNGMFIKIKSLVYKWLTKYEIYDHFKSMANHTECIDLSKERYDFIVSSSDPKSSHLFVLKLLERQKKAFCGRWIQIWGDPFLADISQSKKNNRQIKVEESRLLQTADVVFYVSRLTLNQQKSLYPEYSKKMKYTPIPYVREHLTKNRKLAGSTKISLAYCGDYSPAIRNLEPLYEVVNKNDGFQLIICGDSSKPFACTQSVDVRGRVAYNLVREVEDKVDILVFLANRKGNQIPGKIYQYAGTNKPILFILDGDEEKLKSQFEAYERFVFAHNSSESILCALRKICNSGIEYKPLKEFSKGYIMEQFLNEVEESV